MRLLLLLLLLASCGKKDKDPLACYEEMENITKDKSMLVVGDSISIGYTVGLKNIFSDYSVIHNECNAMSSDHGVKNIDRWVAHNDRWDICTINHGLWDISPKYRVDKDKYIENLSYELDALKLKCDKVIFITTTFVNTAYKNKRNPSDVDEYNDATTDLIIAKGVEVCDLNFKSKTLSHKMIDSVHYTSGGYNDLAAYIGDCTR